MKLLTTTPAMWISTTASKALAQNSVDILEPLAAELVIQRQAGQPGTKPQPQQQQDRNAARRVVPRCSGADPSRLLR